MRELNMFTWAIGSVVSIVVMLTFSLGKNAVTSNAQQADMSFEAKEYEPPQRPSPPSVSNCGINPSLTGNKNAGKITIGSGTVLTCTLSFPTMDKKKGMVCVVSSTRGATVPLNVRSSTSEFVLTSTANMAGAVVSYICIESY